MSFVLAGKAHEKARAGQFPHGKPLSEQITTVGSRWCYETHYPDGTNLVQVIGTDNAFSYPEAQTNVCATAIKRSKTAASTTKQHEPTGVAAQ